MKGLASYTIIVVPAMTAIALVSEQVIKLVLGERWMEMVTSMQILCVAVLLRMVTGYFRNFNISCNNYKKQSVTDIIMVLINITMCVTGVRYGIKGVSVGVAIASGISLLVNITLINKAHGIKLTEITKMMFPAFLGSIVMALVMLLTRLLMADYGTLLSLITQLCFGTATYCIFILRSPFNFIREIVSEVLADARKLKKTGY
jgi:O-antigen/teichoic acid export membrane protein